MKILVLGGTRFLSRAVAEEAVARGHEVTCACRGSSGGPPPGSTHVSWDRSHDAPGELAAGRWDAVVDVARLPSHVRRAVETVPDAHWVFVSTISVYPDDDIPGTPETLRVHQPLAEDVDLAESPQSYGPMKVACEQLVTGGTASSLEVRPGLIVGPGDPSGRFTYWVERLAGGGEVLAPGTPDDVVQVIDARDLAEWIVTAAEERTTGVYDAVGEIQSLESLLAAVASGVGGTPRLTWVPQEFLSAQGVEPWSGEASVPLWLPRPDYDGMMAHDPAPALAAGLWVRPVEDTAHDTAAWLASSPDAVRTGISRQREAEVLAAWAASLRRWDGNPPPA